MVAKYSDEAAGGSKGLAQAALSRSPALAPAVAKDGRVSIPLRLSARPPMTQSSANEPAKIANEINANSVDGIIIVVFLIHQMTFASELVKHP